MKTLEVDLIQLGHDHEDNLTSDEEAWVKNTKKIWNVLVTERDDDEMDIIIDIDVPERYKLIAEMIYQAISMGITLGVIRAV